MSEGTETSVDFEALEGKVNRVVELIRRLKMENRQLTGQNANLKMQMDASGGTAQGAMAELNTRLAQLEKEKTALQDERRLMARRIEEALSKLEFLESESVPQ